MLLDESLADSDFLYAIVHLYITQRQVLSNQLYDTMYNEIRYLSRRETDTECRFIVSLNVNVSGSIRSISKLSATRPGRPTDHRVM